MIPDIEIKMFIHMNSFAGEAIWKNRTLRFDIPSRFTEEGK